ncbi:MAG: MMPL family transporter, partial [Chloroflexota bacterium]|nr:MMPL family transporter [Chloroflexota bacterium]
MTEQLWLTPYVTRVDSIANYSHSEAFEDELIVEPLIDDAASLSDDDIARIETIAHATEEVDGRFVSRDGRVAGLVVSIALPEGRDVRQAAKMEVVDYLYGTAAEAGEKYSTIDYHITGELPLDRAMGDAMNEEFELLGPIALGVMLLVAVLMLRSIWGTVAIVLMIVGVIIASAGFVGWTGMTLFGESAAAIFVLMAIAVAHSVHIIEAMLAGLREGMDRKQAAIHSLELNIWPVFLTSITTAIGFLSLNFSEMPPFQVMGNMVAFGSLFAFFFAVTFLPAVLSYLPMRVRPAREGKVDYFDRLGRFVVSRRMLLLCSFGVLTVALMAGIARIELKENWLELLGESYQFRQSTDFISENFTGVEAFEYSLDAGQEGGVTDVEYLSRVDAFAEWYRAQPEVAHVFAI